MLPIFSVVYFLFCVAYVFRFVQRIFSALCNVYFPFCVAFYFPFSAAEIYLPLCNEIQRAASFSSNHEKDILIYLMRTE